VEYPYSESIAAEIRDAEGDVLTATDYDGIGAGESATVSYSLAPGRYYLVVDSEYTKNNLARSYTFTLNGATVDAATMQGICDEAKSDVTTLAKKVRKAKRALRRALESGTPTEVRKARARLKKLRRAKRRAERRAVTYCVVI